MGAGRHAGGRARAHRQQAAGAGGTGVRALGARGHAGQAAGVRQGEAGARQERGARAAWAPGLATGCALGALGLFSIRFDSVFFLSQFLDVVLEPGS